MSITTTFTVAWLLLSTIIHIHGALPWFFSKELSDPTNNAWYTKSYRIYGRIDARYVTDDTLIASLHGFSFFVDAPLCILLIYSILTNSAYRHSLQIVLSVAHIFGTILFFLGAFRQQFKPITNDTLSFWLWFVALNILWIIVPLLLLLQSVRYLLSHVSKTKTD
jgi:cholestenol delta-isomerase